MQDKPDKQTDFNQSKNIVMTQEMGIEIEHFTMVIKKNHAIDGGMNDEK